MVDHENDGNQGGILVAYTLREQNPPKQTLHDNYKFDLVPDESEEPIVLPLLPPGHTFMVTSSLIKTLITRGLFLGLVSEDPHRHMPKLRCICKSCVGRSNLDMDVIG